MSGLEAISLGGVVLAIIATIIPYWILWKRTGHNGAWSLFLLLPVTNIAVPYILAFKKWPRFLRTNGREER